MPKIGNCEISGHPFFQVRSTFIQVTTMSIYLPNEIRHDIIIQYHWNYCEVIKFNYMLEMDILRNYSQKNGCPERCFLKGLGVQMTSRHPAG